MGREAGCRAKWGGKTSEGWAFLETADLRFRGDFRFTIPFSQMRSVTAKDGVLRVKTAEETAELELGAAAQKWADSIKNPKSVLEKLGVKPGMKVSALAVSDAAFLRDAKSTVGTLSQGKVLQSSDLIFFGVEQARDLDRLAQLRDAIRPDGGIWVIWPKGQPHIKEDHARAAGKTAGLVDVKVVAFSATHSALKLVIPVSQRAVRPTTARAGVRVARKGEAKSAARLVIPAELKRALARSKAALAKFEGFPPSHRREIAGYVAEAKKPETRERRAAQTVEKLASETWKDG